MEGKDTLMGSLAVMALISGLARGEFISLPFLKSLAEVIDLALVDNPELHVKTAGSSNGHFCKIIAKTGYTLLG